MNKDELIRAFSTEENLIKHDAGRFTKTVLRIIRETLMRGEEIEIRGFGCFRIRRTKERPGRNPKTGEPAVVPSTWVVKFKQSKCWRIKKRIQAKNLKISLPVTKKSVNRLF